MMFFYEGVYQSSSKERTSKELEAIEFVKSSFEAAGHGNFVKSLKDITTNAIKRFGKTGENAVLVTLKMMLDSPEVKDNEQLSNFISSVLSGERVSREKESEKQEIKEEFLLESLLGKIASIAAAPIVMGFGIIGAIAGGIAGLVKSGAKLFQIAKKGAGARKKKPDSKGRQRVKSLAKGKKKAKGRKVRGTATDPGKKTPKEAADDLVSKKGGDKTKARQAAVYLMNINKKNPKKHDFWSQVVGHIRPSLKAKLPRPKPKFIKMRKHKARAAVISKKKTKKKGAV
jgi:hypothetical protein